MKIFVKFNSTILKKYRAKMHFLHKVGNFTDRYFTGRHFVDRHLLENKNFVDRHIDTLCASGTNIWPAVVG